MDFYDILHYIPLLPMLGFLAHAAIAFRGHTAGNRETTAGVLLRKALPLAAAAAAVLASCAGPAPADPVAEAIGRVVRAETRVPVHVDNARVTDSTTFEVELDRRRRIQELKIYQDSAYREKYLAKGMRTNARRKAAAIDKSRRIICGLDSIRASMGAGAGRVAYYDYVFDYCTADGKGGRTKPRQAYATVSPDGRVLTWSPDRRDIHKRTGLVIPGYAELLERLREDAR